MAVERQGWSSVFHRIQPGRFVIVEPIALAVHDWSKPQPGQPRMFDQPFLEWFTWVRPSTLALIYVPLAAWFAWLGLAEGLNVLTTASLFLTGLFAWTLVEYVIHRFSFHFEPKTKAGIFFAYMIHGVHHAFPEDPRRWVMPPVVSLPIVLGAVLLMNAVLGASAGPLAAGGVIGYLWYDLVHYAVHRGPLKSPIGAALRRHHLKHHYALPERRFGVSTTLWDHVFRTHQ